MKVCPLLSCQLSLEWDGEIPLFARSQDSSHVLEQYFAISHSGKLHGNVILPEPPNSYIYLKGSFICSPHTHTHTF